MKIWITRSVLTRPLVVGLANLPGAQQIEQPATDAFLITETARFAAWPDHRMHAEAGIAVQDRGVIAFLSAVRADELEDPAIWVRTESATAELVARATLQPYFGFRPSRWVAEGTGEETGVVVDELAALQPIESGFRENLTRAWFVLTGLPLVTHLLAVPTGADPVDIDAVAAWVQAGGGLDDAGMDAVIDGIVGETGAARDDVAALFAGVRWTLRGEERVAAAELFLKARVSGIGPVPWLVG